MEEEIWKDIDGYDYPYQVSNLGRVRNSSKNNIMTKRIHKGYEFVKLLQNKVQKNVNVHRLVAMAFIPNPCNFPQVNHKDENKVNNNVSNLEWCTAMYNVNYGTRNMRISRKCCYTPPLTNKVFIIKSVSRIAELLQISISMAFSLLNNPKVTWLRYADEQK